MGGWRDQAQLHADSLVPVTIDLRRAGESGRVRDSSRKPRLRRITLDPLALKPAGVHIHVLLARHCKKDVNARDKRGNDGEGADSISSERAAVASLKTLQRTRRGGRLKKETRLRGHRLRALAGPSPPWLPDLPSPSPTCLRGRGGQGTMLSRCVGQLAIQRPQ